MVGAGCGGDGGGGGTDPDQAEAAAPATVELSAAELRLAVANAFDARLVRLATTVQPGEDASDLGQDLPKGIVSAVKCAALPAPPGATGQVSCTVRWRNVAERPRRTAYMVELTGGECFSAAATPPLSPILDHTIGASSEHPLNVLHSATRECS